MSAQPASEPGGSSPAEILDLLPERWHEQFLSEYHAALEDARDVRQWRKLAQLLRRWHLRGLAYSDEGFEAAALAARDARHVAFTPIPGLTGLA